MLQGIDRRRARAADNIKTFRRALAPYVEDMQCGRNGYHLWQFRERRNPPVLGMVGFLLQRLRAWGLG